MFGVTKIHLMKKISSCLFACFAWALAMSAAPLETSAEEVPQTGSDNSIVVLMYHRFGEDKYPSTNVRLEQLDAQIKELTSGRYNVLPLPEIIRALRAGEVLPDRTVGISVDDAFRSVHDNAWPRFKAAGLPFTVFVATDNVDRNNPDFMSWDQIKALHEDGVTIAAHSLSHGHLPPRMPRPPNGRSTDQSTGSRK